MKLMRRHFGGRFCSLVFYGLNKEKEGCIPHNLRFTVPTEDGNKRVCECEFENCNSIARGDDPLVIAALLKLYLERGNLEYDFNFGIGEIAEELSWQFNQDTEERISETIANHARVGGCISIGNQAGKKVELPFEDYVFRGLLFCTFKFVTREFSENYPNILRSSHRITFHREFVEGMRKGKVIVGKVCFDSLKQEVRQIKTDY